MAPTPNMINMNMKASRIACPKVILGPAVQPVFREYSMVANSIGPGNLEPELAGLGAKEEDLKSF
jgi:hypothetical protein